MESFPDYKPLFAAYLNMARNNCFIALSHIAEKANKGGGMNEDAMQECSVITLLANNKKPDESLKVEEMIKYHFPFTKSTKRIDPVPSDYAGLIISFIKQLNELRNFHTHYLHRPYATDANVIAQLQFLFDTSRREVRKRFALKEEDVKHLVRKTITIINGEKVVVEKDNYPYAFVNKEGQFTTKGIAFFITLFLEKKHAYLFLKQLRGFKNSSSKQNKATLETYCFYHIRVPQPRLQSQDTKVGYLLDVLEELKRCPKELYSHLSEHDRMRFTFVNDIDATDEQPESILKRNKDRFAHLALRYFEHTGSLKELQFYYDLGKYYFKVYEKSVDSEIRLRRLHKYMKGFGRLNDFGLENMPPLWQQLVKYTDQLSEGYAEPYIVYTIPHYHIVNNQIGIWINNGFIPPLLSPVSSPEPQMWLSIYELPAIMFYHLLTKKRKEYKSVLQILSNHRKAIHLLFKDIKDSKLLPDAVETFEAELRQRGLHRNHIPKPLLEYLLNESPGTPVAAKAENRLIKLQNETSFLFDKIDIDLEKSKEKAGGKYYKPIQTGKIAQFLAKDMLFFQPPINKLKGKATGTLFQVLQARLAFYGRDKHLLEDIYRECNLIQSNNPHPFLQGLPITDSLIDYYRNYLVRRNTYLEKCLKKCMQGKTGSQELHFLHLGEREKRAGNDYYKGLAGKFIKMPLNLPRGLFMEELLKVFSAENKTMQDIADNSRTNTAFLIKEYLKNVLDDDTQDFYNWKRTYAVFNKYYDNRKPQSRDSLIERYFDTSVLSTEAEKIKLEIVKKQRVDIEASENIKRNYRYYSENEKQIRHTKSCDIVLFLIIQDLFPSLEQSVFKGLAINQLKLSDILPDAEKGILSLPIEIRLPLYNKFIIQRGIKLKNYGDFRRFLKDRRLQSLLPYFEEESIDRVIIEKELQDYEIARIEIHRLVLEFEKKVITENKITYENSEINYVDHEKVLTAFFQNEPSSNKKELIRDIRNKFSHNEYPDANKFKGLIESDSLNTTVAKKFIQIAKQYYQFEIAPAPPLLVLSPTSTTIL
ncbi:type VI-B CRISPR-associated RNA-guided ribonuclease Cas13b [Mucilaginibacter sp.]|uniref:type VI-B CRISPR-associated RNA-guided ribonuclease Cas13b n=1 Tax=Mucilaginibacter sp. TaxID=1882438 RepID=UPI0026209F61|nr:type VI-B CRISPR-associated RNA-guided ribonuclease Cas13b [Mucilaginibacter sp.]MDB5032365.1 hypothetical protein [Mucilaginibacter sp.]